MSQNPKSNWQTLLKWFPTGVGTFVTAHFVMAGERVTQAIISFVVTVILALWASLSEGFIRGVKKKADEKGQAYGEAFVEFILEQLPEILRWKLSRFERRYRQSLFDYHRDLKIEGFKIGLPVLDLEEVFVPLKVATEIPEKIPQKIIPDSQTLGKQEQEIWGFLAKSSQITAYRDIAILAPPGYGKTTLLQHLTLTYAKKAHRKYKVTYLIPVLLYLRNVREQILRKNPSTSLPELIRETVQNQPAFAELKPPPQWFEGRLKQGKCLVMFDGLDEVANERERIRVSQWINEQMLRYSSSIFLLTSRPHGYQSELLEKVGIVLEVKSFNLDQSKKFIYKWYLQTEIRVREGRKDPAVRAKAKDNAQDLIERIVKSPPLRDMATNPLLVTMIATVHYCGDALPGRRVELYEKICDVLLGGRLSAKKLSTNLTAGQRKSVLQVLAWQLMERETRNFKEAEAAELIGKQLATVDKNLTPKLFLKEIKEVCGLLVEKQIGSYEFAHLSFQEYLAAAQIKKTQQEGILVENFSNPWWAETIRLYAAQGDATSLIEEALKNSDVNSLTLAYDCLEEGLEIEPAIRTELEDILERGLESQDQKIAKIAAEVRLSRRLRKLLVIDDNRSIDQTFITCAEYQLFVHKQLTSGERFQAGSAKRPITGISWENVLGFCAWLSSKAQLSAVENRENQGVYFYRLPTATEVQDYRAKEHEELGCWNIGESNTKGKGIRVVKTQIPSLFEFDVVTINAQGKEIHKELRYAQYITENLKSNFSLEMVYIPGGKFLMGTEDEEIERLGQKFNWDRFRREKPQHEVTVQSFFMSKYPITQAQWKAISSLSKVNRDLESNPSYFKGDDRPVERVSWEDAVEFCQRLSKQTGKEYRLPTEAEWEYACRAETNTPFHFGETISTELANYNGNYTYGEGIEGEYREQTTPVGYFKFANAFGLYDMHGNLWEWCEDDWHENYQNAPNDGSAWLSRFGSNKVVCSGSWDFYPPFCRSAVR